MKHGKINSLGTSSDKVVETDVSNNMIGNRIISSALSGSNSDLLERTVIDTLINNASFATDLTTVSAQVDSNTSNITANTNLIATNITDIDSLSTAIDTNTTNITDVTSTVQTNSAGWESTEATVNAGSSNWDSTYSTVLANSAGWDESTDLATLSSTIDTNTTNINTLSTDLISLDTDVQSISTQVLSNDTDIDSLSTVIDTKVGKSYVDSSFIPLTGSSDITGSLTPSVTGVTLGEHLNPYDGVFTSFIDLHTLSAPEYEEGVLFWDSDDKTLGLYGEVSGVTLQLGQEQWLRAKNNSGAQLDNGTIVYVSGAQGANPTIEKASALNESTSSNTIGVCTHDITANEVGYVTTFGLVRGLDTSAWAEGAELYLSTVAGEFTDVRPDAPYHGVWMGYVLRSHAQNGIVLVTINNGYELFELHDVSNQVSGAVDNDVLHWDSSLSAWINSTRLTDAETNITALSTDNDANNVLRNFYNGSFQESFDSYVYSDGVNVTATLEQSGGGDLSMQFDGEVFTLDCTPTLSATLTAGELSAPQSNFLYVPKSTKALTVSTSDWPGEEHIKVSYFFVPNAATVQSDGGAFVNQNWNDHLQDSNGQGHMVHMAERSRRDGAYYFSGLDGTGTDGYTTSSAGTVTVHIGSGVVYQMHKHTLTAKDTSVSDWIHVVNASSVDGNPYFRTQNLYDITSDSTGSTLSNRYFNIFLWSVANKTSQFSPIMINIPDGSYNNLAGAEADSSSFDDLSIPREFDLESSTAVPIARLTFRSTGGTWAFQSSIDLRGTNAAKVTGSGGSGGITDHGNLTGLLDDDHTQYSLVDGTRAFTGAVGGIDPVVSTDLTTKNYVDTIDQELSAFIDTNISNISQNASDISIVTSTLQTNSAGWESTEATVNAGSSNWDSVYSTIETNSAGWESTESTVQSNSASWGGGSTPIEIGVACSDTTTDLVSGTIVETFRTPCAVTLTGVRANVSTAPSGSVIQVDINEGGVSILSTKLTIDSGEKTSTTAATSAVISDSSLADDAEITVDIDQVGSTTAGKGLKVWLIGTRT